MTFKRDGFFSACVSAAVFTLAAAFFAQPLFLISLLAAAVHESGHVLAGFFLGTGYESLGTEPGGLIIARRGLSSYRNDLLEAFAGPAANLFTALTAALLGRALCSEPFFAFSGVSLALALFNLLPCLPLDGGRILYAVLSLFFSAKTAFRAVCVTSCAALLFLLISGVYCMRSGGSAALFTAGVCVFFCYCKERENGIK